jgi:RsiW-degrading membrane proteinase PrsW (M82 family)
MIIYLALAIAYGVPLVFLYAVRRFDLYGTGKFWVNFLVMGWGFVAYWVAAQVNPAMIDSSAVIYVAEKFNMSSYNLVIRITGPMLEEFLKAMILVYLVQRADFNYVVDGALYGFGAGIGFAIIENTEYVFGHPDAAIMVAVARVFSTNLMHATGSGVIGTALAYRRGDRSKFGWAIPLLGYAFSMGMHVLFNTMVNAGIAFFIAVAYGFLGVAFIWYIIKRGMNVQKQWVSEKLGMGDRVTDSEAKVVRNIDDLDELLTPILKQFGKEKVELVKIIISKQAEIGIKRKLMDTTPSENKRQEILQVVQGLGKEMDVLRRQAGPYCMMFVRSVYLEQDVKIWDTIGSRIAAASTGQKGGGLFDRANARMKSKPAAEEEEKP